MKYNFIVAIAIFFMMTNFAQAMELSANSTEIPSKSEGGRKIELGEFATFFLTGNGVYFCGKALGCTTEMVYACSFTACIASAALYELITQKEDRGFLLSKLENSSFFTSIGLSYFLYRQCDINVAPALASAVTTGLVIARMCSPYIEKYCYELSPEALEKRKEIEKKLQKIKDEEKELADEINKPPRKLKKKNKIAQLRNKDNQPLMTKTEMQMRIKNLQQQASRLENELAEVNKQKTMKLWKYFGQNKNNVTTVNYSSDDPVSTWLENKEPEIRLLSLTKKKKTKGIPYKEGKGKEPLQNIEENDNKSLESPKISDDLKINLERSNIIGLFDYEIKWKKLIKLLAELGFSHTVIRGDHKQFEHEEKGIKITLVIKDKWVPEYLIKQVIRYLRNDFGITEAMVRGWR